MYRVPDPLQDSGKLCYCVCLGALIDQDVRSLQRTMDSNGPGSERSVPGWARLEHIWGHCVVE